MEKPCQIIFLILISIFVKLSMTSPIINDNLHSLSYITKERNLQRYNKIRRSKLPIIYYANTSATFDLILSGDKEINPGPGFSASKCTVCGNVVKINKRLICSTRFDAIHVKCSEQPSYHTIQARIPRCYIVTVVYTRSCHFLMFQTWIQAMTCVTLLMIIDYQFKIRIRILLAAIKLFLLLILTRKLSVQQLANSHVC